VAPAELVQCPRGGAGEPVKEEVNACGIKACIESAQHMKAPQIKNIFWTMLSSAEGRQLKVNCGVTATSANVIVEEKVIGGRYWK